MRYIQGNDRNQTTLLPEVVDDYIKEDSSVRFIDAYIDNLDLVKLDFTYSETKETAHKPYNPADLFDKTHQENRRRNRFLCLGTY